jgi:hypothetical protein
MRRIASLALLVALCQAAPVMAQQRLPTEPPPNPGNIVPDQRLEVVEQRLFTAGEQLREAAEDAGDAQRTERALSYGHDTVGVVRDVFDDLPPDRRTPYEDAFLKAEQALQAGDPAAAAAAMQALQETIRSLVQQEG